nr:putative adhesion G protein-coupled receptor E4P [Macaca nemestrina]
MAKCKYETYCTNKIGAYICSCWRKHPSFNSLAGFTGYNHSDCYEDDSQGTQAKVDIWENLRRNGSREDIARQATQLIQSVELKIWNDSFASPGKGRISDLDVVYETKRCNETGENAFLEAGNNTMDINCADALKRTPRESTVVALITFQSLGDILNASFFSKRKGMQEVKLNSHVVSGSIGLKEKVSLSEPVFLTFHHNQPGDERTKHICVYWEGLEGGSWSTEGCSRVCSNGSYTKCKCFHLSSFAVLVALAPKEDPVLTVITQVGLAISLLCLFLAILTFLLCRPIQNTSTSLHLQFSLCLFLAHLLFLTGINRTEPEVGNLPKLPHGHNESSHLVPQEDGEQGIKIPASIQEMLRAEHEIRYRPHLLYSPRPSGSAQCWCFVIRAGAALPLPGFSFTWMLLEGLHLFLTVRTSGPDYTPAMADFNEEVHLVASGSDKGCSVLELHGAQLASSMLECFSLFLNSCWLKPDKGFIWSFTGPVAVIILINLVFYFRILWILRSKLSSLNKEVSTIQDTRGMTFKAIAQLFILGCSWGLGLFMVEEVGKMIGSIFAYSFTIINTLQGALLFVVHCLLNRQVRMEYKKWFSGMRKGVETESTEMSRSTTQTKTEEVGKSSEFIHKGDTPSSSAVSSKQPQPQVHLVSVDWLKMN